MYLVENPVLQRELISNLRLPRSFLLLAIYLLLLSLVVLAAWPAEQKLDLAQPEVARSLVNLFFLGQFLLVSMLVPSFAAGAITGEKERASFEMLMASPLPPGAIVLGKLLAALTHIGILMFCSLPIVMLCLPLGGVSPYEVFAAYLGMTCSVAMFGMVSVWASGFFQRTASSLVVSYLMILPLAMCSILIWLQLEALATHRLTVILLGGPLLTLAVCLTLWRLTCRRLVAPIDLGSEGKEVIDLESEASEAVGLYISRDEFPDRLFAPPRRTTLMEEGINPIYDKEMRSEIFAQGTLMLRLVIQISMALALVMMAWCLFFYPQHAPIYIWYVLLFNLMVGPVFSAGSITGERERQTLDLLLTTLVTPWHVLSGKLISGLRVSSVLTSFLLWPVVLACAMNHEYWANLLVIFGYFLIVASCCATTAVTALCCSTIFNKTSTSLVATYAILMVMFALPLGVNAFAALFLPELADSPAIGLLGIFSPFAAALGLPLTIDGTQTWSWQPVGVFWGYLGWTLIYLAALGGAMIWLFQMRWRVAQSG